MNETKSKQIDSEELSVFKGNGNESVHDKFLRERKEKQKKKQEQIEVATEKITVRKDDSEDRGTTYNMLKDLMERYHFISIQRRELYLYVEEEGYWKLILPSAVDIELRAMLSTNWFRYINSATMNELYKWLLIEAEQKSPEIFLKGRHYLNFKDCAYNWKKENVKKDRKELYFNYRLNLKFPKGESTGNFDKFIEDIFGEDKYTKREFSKFIGLCISNIRDLKYVFFLYGPSDSGKSSLLNSVKFVIGEDQCCALSFSQLSNEFYVSSLYGKRLNVSGEISGVSVNKLDVLKSLSGNDSNLASYKFKDAFCFRNTCLLTFACNVLPKVDFMDLQSFVNRMIIFPFRNVVERKDWDEHLLEKLQKDAKGIISFAIKGLQRLEKDNYQIIETPEMARCKNDYAGMYDSFTLFCNEYIKLVRGESVASAEIHEAYSKFCQKNEYEMLKDNQWSQILKRRYSCIPVTLNLPDGNGGTRRQRGYRGVTLKKKTGQLLGEETSREPVTIQQMLTKA